MVGARCEVRGERVRVAEWHANTHPYGEWINGVTNNNGGGGGGTGTAAAVGDGGGVGWWWAVVAVAAPIDVGLHGS